MSVDIKLLKQHGVSAGSYKKIFDGDRAKYPTRVRKLVDLLSSRNRDGIPMGLREWRAFAAIDIAYEVPFDQTTPTLVHNILSKNLDVPQTIAALDAWGLKQSDLFMNVPNDKGINVPVLNVPEFWKLFVPVVKAYLENVAGQIFNERNVVPLLNYNPVKQTERNRVLCELTTDMVQVMSTNFGYAAVLRQSIQHALKYGICLTFPREEWYCEQQLDGDGKPFTVKEGLRYTHPHPTKFFYDLKHPLTSLNTDTGTEFVGYWHILSYGEILDNRDLWNRNNIFAGTNWFRYAGASTYFDEIYPCVSAFPAGTNDKMDREDKASYYSKNNRDQSVFAVEHFTKIIPKDWGLGRYEDGKLVDSYNYPVWHRFKMGGDDTVLYAEPCAYTPSWFMGYNYDEMTGKNSSLGLELIPWQDHLGMILSQMVLTAKQNLTNVIFYDNQQVNKKDIDALRNSGEAKYRAVSFIGFDSLQRKMAQTDINRAFVPVQLSKTPINELYSLMSVVLNMLERVLGISSQDAGASATHQQSKEEVIRTGKASASRRALTAAGIDEGTDGWKRQLVTGSQAYADPEASLQVSADIDNVEQHLADLGWDIEHRGTDKIQVRGKISKLKMRLEHFAATTQSLDRPTDVAASQVLFQTVGAIAQQPELFKQVGGKTMVKLLEQAALLAGAPRDLKLAMPKAAGQNGDLSLEQVQEMIKAVGQSIFQGVSEKIAKPAAQQMAKMQGEIAQQQQVIEQLQGIYKVASAAQDKANVQAQEAAQKSQIDQAEFQAEERRKEERHQLEMKREAEEAALDLKITEEKARTDVAISKATAAAKASESKKT